MTFVCHDAGETDALAPVMLGLSQKNIDYRVLSYATSQGLLAQNPILRSKTVFLSSQDTFAFNRPDVQEAMQSPLFLTGVMTPLLYLL